MTRALVVFSIAVVMLVSPARSWWSDGGHPLVAFVVWLGLIALSGWAVRRRERP